VEKDKNSLLQTYQRLGGQQSSLLDNCKDKFLVQSVAILDDTLVTALASDYEQLTQLWAGLGGNGSASGTTTSAVANKKLAVRHTVASSTPLLANPTAAAAVRSVSREPVDNLGVDELRAELTSLRRKYDELVSFSVNLTAERDMLNNALEQTKRDLNRQQQQLLQQQQGTNHNKRLAGTSSSSSATALVLFQQLALAVVMLLVGIYLQQKGLVKSIPVLGSVLAKDEL
jgi:hypothetical protein